MANAVLIINHIHFPYRLFEQCLHWAKDNHASLKAIFLTNDGAAWTQGYQTILQQIADLERQAAVHEVQVESRILVRPSIQNILEQAGDADKIFIEIQDEESLRDLSIHWHDLLNELGRSRQVVSNKAFRER
jgi:hypothetical protein